MVQGKSFFEEQGYLVLRNVYDMEETQRMIDEYEEIWLRILSSGQVIQDVHRPLESLYPNRIRDYHLGNDMIMDFLLKERVVQVLEHIMEDELLIVQTNYFFKPPGSRGLGFHQDNYYVGVEPGSTYAAWVSLDHATEENGCLLLVPRSHNLDLLSTEPVPGGSAAFGSEMICVPAGYERITVSTQPGDVVLFHGSTLHGSLKNSSHNRYRQAFVTHFAAKSLDKITLNYNRLLDKNGNRIRKRINPNPKKIEKLQTIFGYKNSGYYEQNINRPR